MSNEFEWKTEEEAGWEEEIAVPETRPSRSFPWKVVGLVLVLLVVILGGARWQINRQVSAVTVELENDVRAAHLFLQQVTGRQDEELLNSLLSGRDIEWLRVQKSLVAQGWFSNPPLLGATAVPMTATSPLTVTLSPDLFSAEVQSDQTYHLLHPQGMTETVTLRQTAVYRQGETRWLYAPPGEEFWGRMVFHSGERLSVLYPARDEAVALRLAQDLDDLVLAVCRELATRNCLQRARVQVRFSTEPASLLTGADTGTFIYILNLPAPSLVGLPVVEAGYQALFRAYGVRVATAVISQQVNYQCCRWQVLYQALLDRQLHRLGLMPWPLNPATYDQLAAQPVPGGLTRLLVNRPNSDELEHKHRYAFVEFLESTIAPDVTLAEMQRSLVEARTVAEWVNQFAAIPVADDTVDQAFFRYLLQHTTYAQGRQPPFSLPAASIHLVCNMARTNGAVGIYEYELAAEIWQQKFYEEGALFWAYAQPIPARPELILFIELADEHLTAITYTLLENGQPLASFTLDEGSNNFYLWGSDPHGRYLLFTRWNIEDAPPEFRLLDVEACLQGDCLPELAPGLMIWSPDGRHTLTMLSEDVEASSPAEPPVIWLGDAIGENRQAVGVGQQPFWLDEYTYGYERLGEWVTAVVGGATPRRLFTKDDLLAAIPQAQRPESLYTAAPLVVSGKPDRLYVRANSSTRPDQITYLFAVKLTPDLSQVQTVILLSESGQQTWNDLSPDGRWLVTYEDGRFGGVVVTLQNLQTGDLQTLPFISSNSANLSWSADGEWYVRAGDGMLALGAPDARYEQYIFHEVSACQNVYWKE